GVIATCLFAAPPPPDANGRSDHDQIEKLKGLVGTLTTNLTDLQTAYVGLKTTLDGTRTELQTLKQNFEQFRDHVVVPDGSIGPEKLKSDAGSLQKVTDGRMSYSGGQIRVSGAQLNMMDKLLMKGDPYIQAGT